MDHFLCFSILHSGTPTAAGILVLLVLVLLLRERRRHQRPQPRALLHLLAQVRADHRQVAPELRRPTAALVVHGAQAPLGAVAAGALVRGGRRRREALRAELQPRIDVLQTTAL
jgi:MYXO-CTERM domain-containing protein